MPPTVLQPDPSSVLLVVGRRANRNSSQSAPMPQRIRGSPAECSWTLFGAFLVHHEGVAGFQLHHASADGRGGFGEIRAVGDQGGLQVGAAPSPPFRQTHQGAGPLSSSGKPRWDSLDRFGQQAGRFDRRAILFDPDQLAGR